MASILQSPFHRYLEVCVTFPTGVWETSGLRLESTTANREPERKIMTNSANEGQFLLLLAPSYDPEQGWSNRTICCRTAGSGGKAQSVHACIPKPYHYPDPHKHNDIRHHWQSSERVEAVRNKPNLPIALRDQKHHGYKTTRGHVGKTLKAPRSHRAGVNGPTPPIMGPCSC